MNRDDTLKFLVSLDCVFCVIVTPQRMGSIFLFDCSFYDDIRLAYFWSLEERCKQFITLPYQDKLKFLMSNGVVKLTAEFVYKCFMKRRNFLYY